MKESQVQKKIITYLEQEGYYVFKVIVANRSGIPDIIACSPLGTFVGIEVKAPGKLSTVSSLQELNLREIRSCNGVGIITDSISNLKLQILDIE